MNKLIKISYIVLLFALPIQSSDNETSSNYSSSTKRVRPQEDSSDMGDVAKLAKRTLPNAAFYHYSNEKLNEIWHHPSVLALTPEGQSQNLVTTTSNVADIDSAVTTLPTENYEFDYLLDDIYESMPKKSIQEADENITHKNKLTPEQFAYCREIKAQVLAETNDLKEAKNAYKRAYDKIYNSLDKVKNIKTNYSRNYRKSKKNSTQELLSPQKNKSDSIQSNSTSSALKYPLVDTLSTNDDSTDYNYHDLLDQFIDKENIIALGNENEYSSEQLQDQDSVALDDNEHEQGQYRFYNSSKESPNEVWNHPSVLALTPEQIWKKPLGLSPDSVAIKSDQIDHE